MESRHDRLANSHRLATISRGEVTSTTTKDLNSQSGRPQWVLPAALAPKCGLLSPTSPQRSTCPSPSTCLRPPCQSMASSLGPPDSRRPGPSSSGNDPRGPSPGARGTASQGDATCQDHLDCTSPCKPSCLCASGHPPECPGLGKVLGDSPSEPPFMAA